MNRSSSSRELLRIDDETEYLRYVYNANKYLSKAVVSSVIFFTFFIPCFVSAISSLFFVF